MGNPANNNCFGADIDLSGNVDFIDYSILAGHWRKNQCQWTCGDAEHPWIDGDLTRDCAVDFQDLLMLANEWLNDCDWLNWYCRGADINRSGTVNFNDFADFSENAQ